MTQDGGDAEGQVMTGDELSGRGWRFDKYGWWKIGHLEMSPCSGAAAIAIERYADAASKEARREALEEAAGIADQWTRVNQDTRSRIAGGKIANAIRAAMEKEASDAE